MTSVKVTAVYTITELGIAMINLLLGLYAFVSVTECFISMEKKMLPMLEKCYGGCNYEVFYSLVFPCILGLF